MSLSYCPNCGAPFPPKTTGSVRNFCPICGTKLEEGSSDYTRTRGQTGAAIIPGEYPAPVKHDWSVGRFFLPLIIFVCTAGIVSFLISLLTEIIADLLDWGTYSDSFVIYLWYFIAFLIWITISFVRLDLLRNDLNTIASRYDHLSTPSP